MDGWSSAFQRALSGSLLPLLQGGICMVAASMPEQGGGVAEAAAGQIARVCGEARHHCTIGLGDFGTSPAVRRLPPASRLLSPRLPASQPPASCQCLLARPILQIPRTHCLALLECAGKRALEAAHR